MKASPREVKTEEKSPISVNVKTIKKEPEDRQQASKSPYNGWVHLSLEKWPEESFYVFNFWHYVHN